MCVRVHACLCVRPALTVTVCSSHVVLLGERDEVLHGDCQDEGGQETVGSSGEGQAGCHEPQVHVAQSSLSGLWSLTEPVIFNPVLLMHDAGYSTGVVWQFIYVIADVPGIARVEPDAGWPSGEVYIQARPLICGGIPATYMGPHEQLHPGKASLYLWWLHPCYIHSST